MRIVEQLRQRLGDSPEASFECEVCTARYERRRGNCPACGSTDIREV